MKKKVLFIAGSAVYNQDGYKSRIEMEMGLLYNFELHILIPRIFENEIDFQKDVLIHFHNIKKNRGIVSFYK